ncbi:MAG: integrase core domain-containing protein, partial [Actinomycetota bacterium]|nr:integrase core domain-containing protein [Actinomycetota bacterium]
MLPRNSPCPGTPILSKTPDGSITAVSSPDNGPCFKSRRFAAFVDRHPELIHIRTKRNSPGQNGVRERAFGSLKYEHLYRHEIDDGHDLGLYVERYRQLFNTVRPHQALTGRRPLHAHLEAINDPQTINSTEPEMSHPGFDGDFDARVRLAEGVVCHAEVEEVSGGVVGARDAAGV